jgi:hypothetical protein
MEKDLRLNPVRSGFNSLLKGRVTIQSNKGVVKMIG